MEYSNPNRIIKKNTFEMSNEKRIIPIKDIRKVEKEYNKKKDESK